LNQNK
jgi:hypothetical protein